jgi:MFS family permease
LNNMILSRRTTQRNLKIPKHWRVSILAVLAVGPGLMVNSALPFFQNLVQLTFGVKPHSLFSPGIIGLTALALCIPLGPVLRHKLGARRTYQIAMALFALGSLLAAVSPVLLWLLIGRFLQGAATGVILMIMLPMLVLSFPIDKRNYSLLTLIGGFFGFAVMGMFLGVTAVHLNQWRWVFYLSGALAAIALIFCHFNLKDEHPPHPEIKISQDRAGLVLLAFFSITILVTVNNLSRWAGTALDDWIIAGGILLTIIVIGYTERTAKHPLLSFKMIIEPKPLLGMLITICSNVVMVCSLFTVHSQLRNLYRISSGQHMLLFLFPLIGVIIAAVVCTLFYDKIGPGLLGVTGALVMVTVSIQWLFLNESHSLLFMPYNLILMTAGIGIAVGAGLMGAALGGPLTHLVERMTTVQFIRFYLNPAISVLIAKASLNYTHYYVTALIGSIVVLCLSLGVHGTGKGHKLAHKPHIKEQILRI